MQRKRKKGLVHGSSRDLGSDTRRKVGRPTRPECRFASTMDTVHDLTVGTGTLGNQRQRFGRRQSVCRSSLGRARTVNSASTATLTNGKQRCWSGSTRRSRAGMAGLVNWKTVSSSTQSDPADRQITAQSCVMCAGVFSPCSLSGPPTFY